MVEEKAAMHIFHHSLHWQINTTLYSSQWCEGSLLLFWQKTYSLKTIPSFPTWIITSVQEKSEDSSRSPIHQTVQIQLHSQPQIKHSIY